MYVYFISPLKKVFTHFIGAMKNVFMGNVLRFHPSSVSVIQVGRGLHVKRIVVAICVVLVAKALENAINVKVLWTTEIEQCFASYM